MDVVLERGNELIGVEVKYKQKAVNKAFRNRYPEAKVRIVTADNFYYFYKLFFSNPKKLFKNPILGLGMIFMKSCEFGFGGMGYLVGRIKK